MIGKIFQIVALQYARYLESGRGKLHYSSFKRSIDIRLIFLAMEAKPLPEDTIVKEEGQIGCCSVGGADRSSKYHWVGRIDTNESNWQPTELLRYKFCKKISYLHVLKAH